MGRIWDSRIKKCKKDNEMIQAVRKEKICLENKFI